MEREEAEVDIHGPCKERIAELEARVRELEHWMGKNSSNSSKPPSTDAPGAPAPARPPTPSGRKPGGQPGHPPARRPTIPEDQVDQFVHLYPEACGNCGRGFSSQPPPQTPVWQTHQFVEVPAVSAEVTEVQAHALECAGCGAWTPAQMPQELSGSVAGPRLEAMASLLSGRFRLSRREVQDALVALFGPHADLSLGTISNLERQTTEALAPVTEES